MQLKGERIQKNISIYSLGIKLFLQTTYLISEESSVNFRKRFKLIAEAVNINKVLPKHRLAFEVPS